MAQNIEIAQIGEPILRQQAKMVVDFEGEFLSELLDQMLASMMTRGGVGIAAPQIFQPWQVMIIASRPNVRYPDAPQMEPLELINPTIEKQHGPLVNDWEGCLSVPGVRGWVSRHDCVDINYQDRYGESHQLQLNGFVARIFLHEYDHLIGKTFVDRVDCSTHIVAESVLSKIFSGEIQWP